MFSLRTVAACIAALMLLLAQQTGAQSSGLPAFPGAQGFGSQTRAAYGGGSAPAVYRVTNLNDSGPGSLRAALTASGPRVVIFEISGTIVLASRITITSGYLTVAGQTAPSPGITLRGHELRIAASDVVIQHIRVRPGDTSREVVGALWAQHGQRIIIDHVSMSWGTGTTVYNWMFAGDPLLKDVTWLNCIVSEGLLATTVYPGGAAQARGMLIGQQTRNIAVVRSLFAHNRERNPLLKQNTYTVVVNNLNYNAGNEGGGAITPVRDVNEGQAPLYTSAVGNYAITGPSTESPSTWRMVHVFSTVDPASKVYVADNYQALHYSASNPWAVVRNNVGSSVQASSPPLWDNSLVVLPHTEVRGHVLANAGARPVDRDAVDRRIVNDVLNGTGRFIDSQAQVGGWPSLAVNVRPLTLPANPHADDDRDGYTNLEEWLHAHAAAVEGRSSQTTSAPAPPTGLRIVG